MTGVLAAPVEMVGLWSYFEQCCFINHSYSILPSAGLQQRIINSVNITGYKL